MEKIEKSKLIITDYFNDTSLTHPEVLECLVKSIYILLLGS